MRIKAFIFDLDGVIVSTDEYHYLAWKKIADAEDIPFSREINESLRGISRMESLDIILQKSEKSYTPDEKIALAESKNDIYKELLVQINEEDILPGVLALLTRLKMRDIKVAIGSSSKNAGFILNKIQLFTAFDAIADGNDIKNSKPDPEVFLVAAEKLGVSTEECMVVEDAYAGIDAAIAAGMDTIGVGFAATYSKTHHKVTCLSELKLDNIL